jgi:DNA-binding winged helix-turn-helix (wHTH) protein
MSRYAAFDAFVLDTERHELRRVAPVQMEPQAVRLLEILLKSPGVAIARDTLRQELCGSDEADMANVRVAVQKLRFALGDGGQGKRDFRLVVTAAAGGYRLEPAVRWYDEPAAGRRALWAAAAALAVLALATVAFLRARAPFITLEAPAEIDTHETAVFGEFRGGDEAEVVVYVHPDDRRAQYWPQARAHRNLKLGAWQLRARFGNEFGIDMKQPPPLGFDVVAALVPARARPHFPIDGEGSVLTAPDTRAFAALLRRRGALAVSEPRRIQRHPEPACVQRMARLLSPSNAADGQPLPVLRPPVRLEWEPDVPMHAGLWRDGEEMPVPAPGERIRSGTVLPDLPPGTYQVKVAPMVADKALWCSAAAWFVVPTGK